MNTPRVSGSVTNASLYWRSKIDPPPIFQASWGASPIQWNQFDAAAWRLTLGLFIALVRFCLVFWPFHNIHQGQAPKLSRLFPRSGCFHFSWRTIWYFTSEVPLLVLILFFLSSPNVQSLFHNCLPTPQGAPTYDFVKFLKENHLKSRKLWLSTPPPNDWSANAWLSLYMMLPLDFKASVCLFLKVLLC